MCPPDGCLATGCVGSLVTDKQPVACGIDTINADIGQTYTLTFVVRVAGFESAQSMEKVNLPFSISLVILVISPFSGVQFCGPAGNCSARDLGHQPLQHRAVPLR